MSEIPYPGLNPFSEKDAPFFFGRDKQKREIARSLRLLRLTVLFGESGVGKSSILQAGVVPQLRRDAEQNCQDFCTPHLAVVVFKDWHGKNLLEDLVKQIRASVAEAMGIEPTDLKDEPTPAESLKVWTKILSSKPVVIFAFSILIQRGLYRLALLLLQDYQAEQGRGKLFIILDQFEEYFQSHPQESGEGTFADEFPRWVNHSNLRVNFLIAMREDALAKLHHFHERILNIFDNQIELKRLDRSATQDAIVKPIREYNLRQIVADHFQTSSLTVLSAASGMGKSRILKHGVPERLPRFYSIATTRIKFCLLLLETNYLAGILFLPKVPLVTFSSWQGNPVADLVRQINADLTALFPNISAPEPGTSLTKTLQGWAERISREGGNSQLFIILDQFEEFFQYQPQPPKMGEGSFVAELSQVVNDPKLPVHFLISIRDEARDLLKHFQEGIPNIFDHLLQIKQLGKNSAIADFVKPIEEPAQQPSKAINIEFDLVSKVIEQVKPPDETGSKGTDSSRETSLEQEIEPLLLQVIMERLWQEDIRKNRLRCLRLETFNQLGGTGKILDDYVNERMESLLKEEQDTATTVFEFLVSPDGSKGTFPVLTLAESKGLNRIVLDSLVKKLDDQRILRTVDHSVVTRYEIFHDRLGLPILKWCNQKKLKEEKEKAKQKERERIQRDLQVQKLKEQEEKAKQTARQRIRIGSLIGGGILVFSILISSFVSVKVADKTRKFEKAKTEIEEANQAFAPQPSESSGQIVGLIQAIQAGQNFSDILKSPWFTWNPFFKSSIEKEKKQVIGFLQQMINNIQEKNHFILPLSQSNISSSSFSPDGKLLATGSADGIVRLWNIQGEQSGKDISVVGGEFPVLSLSFNPDGKLLATGSVDGIVRLWNIQGEQSGEDILVSGDNVPVLSLSFKPDGNLLATSSADGIVRLWNIQGEQSGEDISVSGKVTHSLSFKPDENLLATGSADGIVRLWNLQGEQYGKDISILFNKRPWSLSFSNDGQHLAAGLEDGSIRLLSFKKDKEKPKDKGELPSLGDGPVTSISFSTDEKKLIASYINGTVRFWDIQSNEKPSLNNIDNINELLKAGCKWLDNYLETNHGNSEGKDKDNVKNICNSLKK